MIKIEDIERAVEMIYNPSQYLSCLGVHKQLVQSLEVYLDRNEFDGSLESAIECLELAGYEVEK